MGSFAGSGTEGDGRTGSYCYSVFARDGVAAVDRSGTRVAGDGWRNLRDPHRLVNS